jgi:hypothetical protein
MALHLMVFAHERLRQGHGYLNDCRHDQSRSEIPAATKHSLYTNFESTSILSTCKSWLYALSIKYYTIRTRFTLYTLILLV